MQDSKTAIFKDQTFFDHGEEDRLNSSSPHPKILPVNQPSFPNTADYAADPLCLAREKAATP